MVSCLNLSDWIRLLRSAEVSPNSVRRSSTAVQDTRILSLNRLLQKMQMLIIALLLAALSQSNAFTVQRGIGLQAPARSALFRVHRPLFAANLEELREDGDRRMQKSVENLKLQLGTIRAGKATYVCTRSC
jgi:hypothetical protein